MLNQNPASKFYQMYNSQEQRTQIVNTDITREREFVYSTLTIEVRDNKKEEKNEWVDKIKDL